MREVDGRRLVSRVKGRAALEKRLRALLVSVHRFGRCRAATEADRQWTARAIDRLMDVITDTPVREAKP
jgi:hypothetical protein